MPRPLRTVIIHGWSDCSDSLVDLKKFLVSNGMGDVRTIYYADYELSRQLGIVDTAHPRPWVARRSARRGMNSSNQIEIGP